MSHEDTKTPRRGHGGATTSREGATTSREGATTSREGATTSREGAKTRRSLIALLCLLGPASALAQSPPASSRTGAELYRSACAACHGADGTGVPTATLGFDTPVPDFTDCSFGSPEADADWVSVVHDGGGARAFDSMMPAFGEALSLPEIELVVSHLRTFCTEPGWPRGDLNLPRPLLTEKAYPENEAVLTMALTGSSISNEFLYERRLGRRGQWELIVPLELRESNAGRWQRGLGDLALAYKHVLFDSLPRGAIVSGGLEVVLPTGKEGEGLGGGVTAFEPFASYSQLLPRDIFFHLHGGAELPVGVEGAEREAFWRATFGRTLFERRWYRAWSPMVELLGARTLADGAQVEWDLVPQLQVTLSTRQHVLLNVGVRTPLNDRAGRRSQFITYLLWDWFDGGFFDGW